MPSPKRLALAAGVASSLPAMTSRHKSFNYIDHDIKQYEAFQKHLQQGHGKHPFVPSHMYEMASKYYVDPFESDSSFDEYSSDSSDSSDSSTSSYLPLDTMARQNKFLVKDKRSRVARDAYQATSTPMANTLVHEKIPEEFQHDPLIRMVLYRKLKGIKSFDNTRTNHPEVVDKNISYFMEYAFNHTDKAIKSLDRAFAKVPPTKKGMVVYRFFSHDIDLDKTPLLPTTSKFLRTYQSATTNINFNWAGIQVGVQETIPNKAKHMMKIYIPPGSKVLPLGLDSEFQQSEILFNRNSRFKYKGVDENGYHQYHLLK